MNWAGHSRANSFVLSVRLAYALLFVTIFVFALFNCTFVFRCTAAMFVSRSVLAPANGLFLLSILPPSFKLKNLACN